jgi:hypothetical protein
VSIQGNSFTGAFVGGAHMDFGVGIGGMSDVFSSDYTIAILEKGVGANRGLLGAFADTSATNLIREFFLTNNLGGGRLFGDNDFSDGYPSAAVLPSGLNDNVWRWSTQSKATAAAHYQNGYADLAGLTWQQGESVNAGNHGDSFTPAVMLSTWAIYPLGFNAQDIAAIVVWPYQLTPAEIRASCTKSLADVYAKYAPMWLVSFKQTDVASTIIDLTGNGANETARPNVIASADPPGFNFTVPTRETLWLPSDKPGPGDYLDATDGVPTIATGTSFDVTAPGVISAVRFFATTNARTGGGSYVVNLHEVTADDNTPAGTLLSSSAAIPASSFVNGTWNEIPLTTPVNVQPGHVYRVSMYSGTSGRYVATLNYFSFGTDHFSAGGHVRAWHNGNNPDGTGTVNNGVFTIGGGSPTDMPYHTTGANYWVDPVYAPSGGAPAYNATQFLPFF